LKDRDLFETVEEVFDIFTEKNILLLYRKNILKKLYGVVSSGKESRIYWGLGKDNRELAVKIYLTMTAEFRRGILKYIIGDPRFERIPVGDYRKLIYEWTRKEYRNLRRMRTSGVSVPEPIAFYGNVLIMEFLGEKGRRAPLLKEMTPILEENRGFAASVFSQVVDNYRKTVCNARLIHADLSEFNIMYWNDTVYFIDVSQAVSLEHPYAREFLGRDLRNLALFFSNYIEINELEESISSLATHVESCSGINLAIEDFELL